MKDWEKRKLKDCFKLKSGDGLTSKKMKIGDYPVYGGNGIAGVHNEFNLSGKNVIVGRVGAQCGNVRFLNEDVWLTDNAFKIVDFKYDFDLPFLTYFLNYKDLRGYARQAAQPVISNSSLKDIELEFPSSLKQQQQIVAILDKTFAAIAKAKANAEQNLKNANQLFESYLQNVFENKGDGWEEKTFREVCEIVGGSQPSKDNFIYEPKEGYIRLVQVRDYRTDKFITYIPKEKARKFCSKDDIMIGRYGPPIFGIFKGIEGAYNVALMKAVINFEICTQDYFYWFLKNNKLRKFVEKSSKRAAGQDGVRKELLYKYKVSVPPIESQKIIVQNLERLSEETKKLATIYQQKIEDLEELKKSVLQKAFNGELTIDN